MNQTFVLGQLRLLLVALLSYAAGHGWITASDSSIFLQIATPIGALAGPWIWSVYVNLGKKIVRAEAVVVDPIITPKDNGKMQATVITPNGPVTGVIKVLIIGILLSAFVVPNFAFAQTLQQRIDQTNQNLKRVLTPNAAQTSAAPNTLDQAVAQFHEGVQKLTKEVVDKAISDLNAAITDATNHNDKISLPCWQANLALFQSLPSQWQTPPSEIGIALSIQIQRDLLNSITGNDATSLKVACAALWGDQLKIVANVGALIGVRIASGGLF